MGVADVVGDVGRCSWRHGGQGSWCHVRETRGRRVLQQRHWAPDERWWESIRKRENKERKELGRLVSLYRSQPGFFFSCMFCKRVAYENRPYFQRRPAYETYM